LKLEDINFILLRQYYRDDYPSLKSILDPYRKLEEFITHRQFERIRQHCADHQIKPHENAMQLASNIGHWVGVQLLVSLGGKVTSQCVARANGSLLTREYLIEEYEKQYKQTIESYEQRIMQLTQMLSENYNQSPDNVAQ